MATRDAWPTQTITKCLWTLFIAAASLTMPLAGCSQPSTKSLHRPPLQRLSTKPQNIIEQVHYDIKPWTFMGTKGFELTSKNYRIYTTVKDRAVRERFPAFMESALLQYRTTFGQLAETDQKLNVYIMQDRRQWKNLSRQLMPEHAQLLEMVKRGGFSANGIAILFFIDWASQSNDTMTIAAHEGWHQYMQTTFANQVPAWLDEGLATYLEGHRINMGVRQFDPSSNRARQEALRANIQADQVIPLRQLMNEPPQTFLQSGRKGVLLYYAQVWALTHYLMEHPIYRKGLERMLADAQGGTLTQVLKRRLASMTLNSSMSRDTTLGQAVVTEYFDPSFDQFESGYWRFARKQAAVATITQ